MKKTKHPKARYICPHCMTLYEVEENDFNNTTPRCFNCDSLLLKRKARGEKS